MQTPSHPQGATRVVELRRYTLHPGQRDVLVNLFEREFIETQEALGLQVLGIFTEPAHPEQFVWLRGFAGMAERLQGLQAFYGGPVWQQHRHAANATMVDSDNVLLLRPLKPWPAAPAPGGPWFAAIFALHGPLDEAQRQVLRNEPGLWLETEPQENDFPRLPVKAGHWLLGLAPTPPELPAALQVCAAAPAERLALIPTARSPLR